MGPLIHYKWQPLHRMGHLAYQFYHRAYQVYYSIKLSIHRSHGLLIWRSNYLLVWAIISLLRGLLGLENRCIIYFEKGPLDSQMGVISPCNRPPF